MAKSTLLITGANGFVGKAVLAKTLAIGHKTLAVSRGALVTELAPWQAQISTLNEHTNWQAMLAEVKPEVVIHTAALVHQMHKQQTDAISAYRAVNTAGTLNLARQAAHSGVKRFIFISTIKVNGEQTANGEAFTAFQSSQPADIYGASKAEAELGLRQIAAQTGLEVVIIRPPLVYGLGVKANFAAMLNVAKKNLPLPLGAINNKRSLVALDNLVSLIITCINHPKAVNQTFLVSDDHDISTTELLQMITRAAGKTPWLLPVPVSWLTLLGKLAGKQAVMDRVCGNLQLDISHTKQTLGWTPPISVEEGIQRCFAQEDLC